MQVEWHFKSDNRILIDLTFKSWILLKAKTSLIPMIRLDRVDQSRYALSEGLQDCSIGV